MLRIGFHPDFIFLKVKASSQYVNMVCKYVSQMHNLCVDILQRLFITELDICQQTSEFLAMNSVCGLNAEDSNILSWYFMQIESLIFYRLHHWK
jgi:hypothetical protein